MSANWADYVIPAAIATILVTALIQGLYSRWGNK